MNKREKGGRHAKTEIDLESIPTTDDLVELGKHLSFTERRSEDAERELRQVKTLELLQKHVGEDFRGVVTGITNFGIFIQLDMYLVDGLIRYEDLMGDRWEVNDRQGSVHGRGTGVRIHIGDVVTARIVKVNVPRRELNLAIVEIIGRTGRPAASDNLPKKTKKPHRKGKGKSPPIKGGPKKQVLKRRRRRHG